MNAARRVWLQENADDRPAPIIHRNFDDVYTGNGVGSGASLGNPLNLMSNFNIPLPSLPEGTDLAAAQKHKLDMKRLTKSLSPNIRVESPVGGPSSPP